MRVEPAVIDLDWYRADQADDPDPAGPDRMAWGTWRRRWLPAALVVLVVLLASGLTAAAPPAPPPLVKLWTVPDLDLPEYGWGNVVVHGQAVYVTQSAPTGWTATAYDLADGTRQWETAWNPWSDRAGGWVDVVSATPVVLIIHSGEVTATTALDPANGEVLWSGAGGPDRDEVDGRLVMWHDPLPGLGSNRLSLVDPWTGIADLALELGGEPAQSAVWRSPDDGEAYVFTLDPDGLLSRHQFAEGGTVLNVETPHQRELAYLRVLEDTVFVADDWPDQRQLVAYDPGTLTPRWSVPGAGYVTSCGPVLCVWMEDRAQGQFRADLVAVDPATGAPQWTVRCDDETDIAIDAQRCGVSGQPLADGGRLWLSWSVFLDSGGGLELPSWIVDARTGQRLAGPTDWELVEELDDGSLLLNRREGVLDTRIWWARSAADLSGLVVLGAVDADWCGPRSYPFLTCSRDSGADTNVSVWQVTR